MSDYVKATDFAAKDGLASGNAAKVAKGTEVDAEFEAIETAIASKVDESREGVANGIATLDGTGVVPASQLPAASTDADTLDGLDSTAFAQKAANETITGTWTFSATPSFPVSFSQDSFKTITATAGSNVVASGTADTLNFVTSVAADLSITADGIDTLTFAVGATIPHKATAETISAKWTFSSGLDVTGGAFKSTRQAYTLLNSVSSSSGTTTINVDNGNVFRLALTENTTLANPSGTYASGQTFTLIVKQDATGSRTMAFGTKFKFPGGTAPTLSTGANDKDVLNFVYDGTDDEFLLVPAYDFS